MGDLTDLQAAQSVKVVGSDSSGSESTPLQTTNSGAAHVNIRSSTGVEITSTTVGDRVALDVNEAEAPTYTAGTTQFNAANSPTDVFSITGSDSKVIRIKRITVGASATNPLTYNMNIVKRSTANSGGTSSTLTNVPLDSNDSAATATVRQYTSNPTTGTLVGIVRSLKFSIPQNNPLGGTSNGPQIVLEFGGIGAKCPVLRGTSQVLAINMNAVTLAGNQLSFSVEWTEEDT